MVLSLFLPPEDLGLKGRGSACLLCDHIPAGNVIQSEMAQKSDVGKLFKCERDDLQFGVGS